MFKPNPKITAAVDRAFAAISAYKPGQTVPWDVIERAAGFPRYTQHWAAFYRRLCREIRDRRQTVTWYKGQNGGLRLLTNEEALFERTTRRRRKALSQYDRDLVELQTLPRTGLSAHHNYVRTKQIEAAEEGRLHVEERVRFTETLRKGKVDIPRPPRT